MKKFYTFLFLFFCLAGWCLSQTLQIGSTTYNVDTLANHQAGPGTQYVSLRLTTTSKRLDVFFLKTDLKNPYIEIRAALGRDSIYGGERPSSVARRKSTEKARYFAGTNGDFYATSGYVGYPGGGNMIDGEIARIPNERYVFTIDDNNLPDIGLMSYEGLIKFGTFNWAINSVNHLRGNNKMLLFNQLNGKSTHTNQYGTEVLIELEDGYSWGSNKTLKAKVLKVEKNVGNMAIPKGKAVLSGHGTAATQLDQLSVDDEIDISLNLSINGNSVSNFLQISGGDPRKPMLQNGVYETSEIWNELHPRTGLGYTLDKDTLIFCVIDGRGKSNGATTLQLAELMKSAGAHTAYNMDGGGSSCMYIEKYGGPVNTTSDGSERAVANSVFIVSSAPDDNEISEIKPYKTSISLPAYGKYTPQFYAYNQYGTLMSLDLQGVELSCPESLGTIVGNTFIATGDKSGVITAVYNGTVTANIAVNFLDVTNIEILLDSVLIDNRKDYPIEVIASTALGTVLISSDALTWEVEDNSICSVENGILKALRNGRTKVNGQIGSIADDIYVTVEIPDSPVMIGDSLNVSEWTLKTATQYKNNAVLNQENLPGTWTHGAAVNFTHATGRSPYITLEKQVRLYGLPDTIKIMLNVSDIAISNAIVSFRANNSSAIISKTFNNLAKNQEIVLDIAVDQLFSTQDKGIYPIFFENILFYITASEMTVGQAYTLAIKDITLVYNDYNASEISAPKTTNFTIYPNPLINKEFYLKLKENNSQKVKTEIYNLSGQKLSSMLHGTYTGNAINIPVKNLSAGIYLLRIYENENFGTVKIVVP